MYVNILYFLNHTDSDGDNEVLICYADRCVRLFRWKYDLDNNVVTFTRLIVWELATQIGNIALHRRNSNSNLQVCACPLPQYEFTAVLDISIAAWWKLR